jgi:fatty-acyl-CoA synthase
MPLDRFSLLHDNRCSGAAADAELAAERSPDLPSDTNTTGSKEWFPKLTLGSLPERAARRWGSREALWFEGRRWSFEGLAAEVDRAARGLLALGVAPGERVALWMLNRPEWVIAAFAAFKIGAVLLPINTRLRAADIDYILRQSGAGTLIINDRSGPIDYQDMVLGLLGKQAPSSAHLQAAAGLPELRQIVVLGDARPGTLRWETMLAGGAAIEAGSLQTRAASVSPDATAYLMYTSGTTGEPKGVMHQHAVIRNVIDRGNRMGISVTDSILMYLPLFHMFGFTEGLLMSMLTGARQVLTPTFDARQCLALIESERATVLHGFDLHFKDLLDAHAAEPRDVSSVRTGILASGMSSSWPIARQARKTFGPMLSGFGMTEFCVGAAMSALDSTEEQCVEASGYPAPGYEIRIVDPETGQSLPENVPGEIQVRGYTMMQGYYRKPVETAAALDSAGWLHTGDMGILRPDGHLRFMGRYKDMLKIGGENVDPMEVEAYLMTHPAVDLAVVISYPDSRLSEVGIAYVRSKAGQSLEESGLIDYCRGRIASFKIPRRVVFIDELPMTSSGKIQKAKLREDALKRFPPG